MLSPEVPSKISSLRTEVYNQKVVILHAVSLRQGCPHCGRFLTAASRRSLGRVSVPVWLVVLSDQLHVIALVSHYLTNKLICRRPLPNRESFTLSGLSGISTDFSMLSLSLGWVPTCYAAVRRSSRRVARLACVRRTASVHSEPGSNSSKKRFDTDLCSVLARSRYDTWSKKILA